MMDVITAPPSAPATAAPAGRSPGRADDGGEFARLLATHAGHASTESEATHETAPEEAMAALEGEGDDGDAVAIGGASPKAMASEQAVLPAVVAPPAVTADVVPPAEADLPADGGGTDAAAPSGGAVAPGLAEGDAATTVGTIPAATTETASATAGTSSTQTSTPASSSQVPSTDSTTPAQAAPGVVVAAAAVTSDVVDGTVVTTPDTPDTARPTSGAQGATGAKTAARDGAGPVPAVSAGTGEVAAATTAGTTEKVDGAGRGPAVGGRPAARVATAPQGQADMGAAASATADVDGSAPTATRPAETAKPVPTAVLDRVMRAVEALENAPPPKRVSFEVDGLRLTVSLRGDEVNVAVRGGGDQLGSGWQRDLDGALRGRGLGLTDGQGSDTDRGGDGRRHPDQRAPHRSPRANPAFGPPGTPDTSTDLQL